MTVLDEVRKTIVEMAHSSKASHVGSALSVVEILYALYFKVTNISKSNVSSLNRDKVILSKGHGSAALYSILYHKEILSKEQIKAYSVDGGCLPCHIDMNAAKGLDASTGALGHGLGIGVGMAIANRIDSKSNHVYVIIGDGEAQEGSVWEAVALAGSMKLDNITVIVDYNGFQASGKSNDVINQSNLSERFKSFGFDAFEVDGHNVDGLAKVFNCRSSLPKAVIAHTKKGKGLSFMEDTLESHYMKITDELFAKAMSELGEKQK